VVLTGVDLTSWGADLPGRPPLGDLVQRILRLVPDLPRLRISSIDSIEADPALVAAIGSEPRLMPHLHLSLQAGDDMILKRMKRRHSRADSVRFCEQVRRLRPDMVFGADLIAGFPTETEAMFENTLSIVDDCGLTYLHVFPFSPRKGTPAARMPQLDRQTVKGRAKRLRDKGADQLKAHLAAQVGGAAPILMETEQIGRTPQFAPVRLAAPLADGTIVEARFTGHDGVSLEGTLMR
jgi:threonylcarbamoyladenosine tRNA methylthiotransferase MtaB